MDIRNRRALVPIVAVFALFAWTGLVAPEAHAADCVGASSNPLIVKFELGSAEVAAADRDRLKEYANTAKHKRIVCVAGQADKSGDPAFNRKLALKRAEAVADVLTANGVAKERMELVTRGEAFGENLKVLPTADTDRRVKVTYGN